MHPLDRASEMLRFYGETTATSGENVKLFSMRLPAPDGSGNKVSAVN